MASSNDAILHLDQVTRRFGGLTAVNGVSFDVMPGEIFSIIGPNGAGKSTLFNLVTGVTPLSSGRVAFEGSDVSTVPVHKIAGMGISRTFQSTQILMDQSAAYNVMLGLQRESRATLVGAIFRSRGFRREERRCRAMAEDVLVRVGLGGAGDLGAAELSTANQQRLAIAMAIASGPKLLLLDEPTGGLIETEVDDLMHLIATLREGGLTVLLIEHKMRMVMSISDRIAVLDHGELISIGPPKQVRNDPRVLEAYLGANYVAEDH